LGWFIFRMHGSGSPKSKGTLREGLLSVGAGELKAFEGKEV
jgi:hypothetical protein